jgi:alpha-galactosidase
MSRKIAIIGSGSYNFTAAVVRDILTYPALADARIALMDIDDERLEVSRLTVAKLIETGQYPATVMATRSRVEALKDADAVICTIRIDPLSVWRKDLEIPLKYGVDINVGDTRGPAGIFRALRAIPVMLDICADIERYCPEAVFLNYTNPMPMLCKAMQSHSPVNTVGICHSVQGTAEMLARWLATPPDRVSYLCAGINHQAWFLKYCIDGQDAIPRLRQAILEQQEIYEAEIVRNEMFLHLDYYVTESSGHNSEYNPWFRKRKDLMDQYCRRGTSWNPGETNFSIRKVSERDANRDKEKEAWLAQTEIDLKRGKEYASGILNALIGDGSPFEFNANLLNKGMITNLPDNTCVEVPAHASLRGIVPCFIGDLPAHLAILNNINARCDDLAVAGSFAGDPRMVFHAICHDPLTAAVLSLAEIRQMVDELFQAHAGQLPQFRHLT